ncbi:hypothetical protein UFOVP1247_281 [uncultured Caudovirales phage]|uniref:Uncharacterized protein n=1 Tax=uncultured Caudovirales phage TaxID=2100421 RepID=A0A6J5PUX7_9CAUD|nr:hypothetical protein UFOVP970_321 [uncultured Caudovirales phage]CAB4193910.1 hypothetical protein UFOVP1247_281 [uncultured Caudovirales phage]
MEAKLIKTGNEYLLKDLKGEVLAITSGSKEGRMLSLKNCQAIERCYDLGELADEVLKKHNWETFPSAIKVFKEGFQKALEILGDKKFSEEDIIDCWETAHQAGRFEEKGIAETNWQTAINYAQSLQQTEWDVEIDDSGISIFDSRGRFIPKLDTDGCLILKRK